MIEQRKVQSAKGETHFFLAAPAVIWQILFLYVPFTIIIIGSFFKRWHGLKTSGLTFEHYTTIFNAMHAKIIGWSLGLALLNTAICVVIAFPVAYFLALKIHRWKYLFLFLLTLPFWIDFLSQVYSWFFILDGDGVLNLVLLNLGLIKEPLRLLNSSFAIGLVMTYCYLPFMIMPIYSILEKLDLSFIEASLDLGASHWQTLCRITLPLSLSGIKIGFFLVLIPSFGEFVIPTLLGGEKYLYVGTLITDYFLELRDPGKGAAFTFVSSLVLLLVSLFIYWFFERKCKVSAR